MSPQTETKASVGFKAGVKDYKLTYYTPEYETKDTDILAAFRVTPQPGVPPEEAGAAVAADLLPVHGQLCGPMDSRAYRYKGRCYGNRACLLEKRINISLLTVVTRLYLFKKASVTNMFTSIVGNVFGFKALRALRLEICEFYCVMLKLSKVAARIQVESNKIEQVWSSSVGMYY